MRQHLDLHFESEQSSDDKVLAIYPVVIRKRVLRHLYLDPLRQCYLFKRCKPKFMDAVLASCRTDLFMPNVQLVSVGDIVGDLYIVIEGEVEVVAAAGGGGSASHGAASGRGRRGSGLGSDDGAGAFMSSMGQRGRRTSLCMSDDGAGPGGGGGGMRSRRSSFLAGDANLESSR